MKNLGICFIFIFGLLLLTGCSLDDGKNDKIAKSTIQLYDKPLPVIKSYIEGKWQLHYGKGGLIANYIIHFDNTFWEFDFSGQDRIKLIYDGIVRADTTIIWNTRLDPYWGKTYFISFYPKQQHVTSNSYIIDGIYNDTLKIHTYAADGRFYYFTRYQPKGFIE